MIDPIVLMLALVLPTADGPEPPDVDRLRVPVALAWAGEGRLLVGFRASRSIGVVEAGDWRFVDEWPIDAEPASLVVQSDGAIVVGTRDGLILVLDPSGQVKTRVEVGRGPVSLATIPGKVDRIAAGAVWDGRIVGVDVREGRIVGEKLVPIAPGSLVGLPDGRVAAADAFGDRLVVFDPERPGSLQDWRVGLVNVKGLKVSEATGELFLVGMANGGPTQVTRTNLDWGVVLSSKLASARLEAFDLDPADRPGGRVETRQLKLDGSANGAADPADLAISDDGLDVFVALGGAHQVIRVDRTLGIRPSSSRYGIGDSQHLPMTEVGRNPSALVLSPGGAFAASADSMSDTLTILSTESLAKVAVVRLGLPADDPGRSVAIRGEAAFRDGRNALDRWISCASCHPGGHTVGLRFDTLGDGSYGRPKDTPSLLGVGQTAPYSWLGRFETLEDQVEKSLRTSLHGPNPSAKVAAEIAAYLRTLPPPPSSPIVEDSDADRGAIVFDSRGCIDCHAPPTFTSPKLRNPWPSAKDEHYSPPSLRGVARTAPYFHDARAASLAEALERHHPGQDGPPPATELADLIAYLKSL